MRPDAQEADGTQRLHYGDEVIVFQTRVQTQRRISRISIHVEPDGRVVIDAPASAAAADVRAALRKRAAWVSRQVASARQRRAYLLPREFVSGESVLYLGRRYRLKVVVDAACTASASLRGAFLVVTVRKYLPELVRDAVSAWRRQRARSVFADRLAAVASPLRWVQALPAMRLRMMKVQWGSCSPAGRLTMNPMLVQASRECIDYVLLHELIHLRHHNHSPDFYRSLGRHMPNWRAVKLRLDGMAEEIFR